MTWGRNGAHAKGKHIVLYIHIQSREVELDSSKPHGQISCQYDEARKQVMENMNERQPMLCYWKENSRLTCICTPRTYSV
jgi:hypothetical protein